MKSPPPVYSLDAQLEVALEAAATAVRAGQCVVLPTDTVYGIGADAFSPTAVQLLLDTKHRGRDMPPPVLLADASMLNDAATDVPPDARRLADAFWPGALTLILRAKLPLDLGDRPDTIALRVPNHDGARELLRATGLLAVSSANLSGLPPATTVQSAADMFGDTVAVYLDGGPTPGETPSTIVDLSQPGQPCRVVRQGAISLESLREVCPDLQGAASA